MAETKHTPGKSDREIVESLFDLMYDAEIAENPDVDARLRELELDPGLLAAKGMAFIKNLKRELRLRVEDQARIEELEKELLTLITFSADLQHRLEAEKAELVEVIQELCDDFGGKFISQTHRYALVGKLRAALAKTESVEGKD